MSLHQNPLIWIAFLSISCNGAHLEGDTNANEFDDNVDEYIEDQSVDLAGEEEDRDVEIEDAEDIEDEEESSCPTVDEEVLWTTEIPVRDDHTDSVLISSDGTLYVVVGERRGTEGFCNPEYYYERECPGGCTPLTLVVILPDGEILDYAMITSRKYMDVHAVLSESEDDIRIYVFVERWWCDDEYSNEEIIIDLFGFDGSGEVFLGLEDINNG